MTMRTGKGAGRPGCRRSLIAAFVFHGGLALSLVFFVVLRNGEKRELRDACVRRAERQVVAVEKALREAILQLESIHAFYACSNERNRDEFRKFVASSLGRARGVTACQWVPAVSGEFRRGVEMRAREDGLEGYQFHDLAASGARSRAPDRAAHFPVLFVEPYRLHAREAGLDLAAFPDIVRLLDQARDSGRAVTLPSPRGRPDTVLMARAVYDPDGTSLTTPGRRRHHRGFVIIRLDLPELAGEAVAGRQDLASRVAIHVSGDGPQELASGRSAIVGPEIHGPRLVRSFETAGRTWTIESHVDAASLAGGGRRGWPGRCSWPAWRLPG